MAERDENDEERVARLIGDYASATTVRARAAVIVRMGEEPDERLAATRVDFLRELVAEESDDLGEKTWLAAAKALMAFEMQNQIEIYWDWRSPFTDFIRDDIARLLGGLDQEHPGTQQEHEGHEDHEDQQEREPRAPSCWDRFVEWWNKVDPQ